MKWEVGIYISETLTVEVEADSEDAACELAIDLWNAGETREVKLHVETDARPIKEKTDDDD